MNVAGTLALLEPPAGLLTLVPGEPPPEFPVLVLGSKPAPPELDVVDVLVGDGVLVELAVPVEVDAPVEVEVDAVLVLLVGPVVLVSLAVLGVAAAPDGADDVVDEAVECLEPPQAASSAATARAPKSRVKCLTLSAYEGITAFERSRDSQPVRPT